MFYYDRLRCCPLPDLTTIDAPPVSCDDDTPGMRDDFLVEPMPFLEPVDGLGVKVDCLDLDGSGRRLTAALEGDADDDGAVLEGG